MHFLKDCHCHSHKTELFPDNSIMSFEPINHPCPTQLHTGKQAGVQTQLGIQKAQRQNQKLQIQPRYIGGSISPGTVSSWQALKDGLMQLRLALALTCGAMWLSPDFLLPLSFNFPKASWRAEFNEASKGHSALGFVVMTYGAPGARVIESCGEGASRLVSSILTLSSN